MIDTVAPQTLLSLLPLMVNVAESRRSVQNERGPQRDGPARHLTTRRRGWVGDWELLHVRDSRNRREGIKYGVTGVLRWRGPLDYTVGTTVLRTLQCTRRLFRIFKSGRIIILRALYLIIQCIYYWTRYHTILLF